MNDQKQRDQALDISQSFIVQAPAGSGKTELLAQRYLKLLTTCNEPENVMAMTFTNKAVNELIERVLSALKLSNQPRPEQMYKQITYDLALAVMQRSDEKNWQLLQNPKRLKISTIDSLNSLIANRYPLQSQLVPRQIMAQSWQREDAYQYAAEQTLLMIDDELYGDKIAYLLLYLDNNVDKFYKLVTKMLAKRDQWLTRLYRDGAMDLHILKDSAKKIILQHLQHLHGVAKGHLNERFFALISVNTNQDISAIKSIPGHDFSQLESWKLIGNLCLTTGGTWRKVLSKKNGFTTDFKVEKNDLISLFETLSGQTQLQKALHQLAQLPDTDLSSTQTEILGVIAQVLKLCTAHLDLHFKTQQAQDFIEVALNANQALDGQIGVSDVALFLDYKIQHLLIDEFQDTSASQFNILEKLINEWQDNDGKTLFLVGDPMQSIYRFRESQVGLFLQVKEKGIASIFPKSLVLSSNFRSSKSIVESNNDFFKTIFPAQNNVHQGAISYSHSHPVSADEDKQAIKFYPFADNQFLCEAQVVSKIVQATLINKKNGTIAILVRNRSHLQHIMSEFKQNDIVFEALDIMKLENQLLTRDLFSLTKALLNLGDKLAWLSVLRAPWCGLILDDLLILSSSDTQIIYKQLNDKNTISKLSKDGQKRSKHLYRCLKTTINNQGRFNFVELLSHALDQLGMINNALSDTELVIKEKFLRIIFECEQQQSLNSKTIENALKDLYAPSNNALVKLMTIHQSKGLEFDTVIIPGLGRIPRSNESPIIHMHEFANQSLLIAPIKAATDADQSQNYKYLHSIESKQNEFEVKRLLYVAMTRAKTNLHLLGAVGRNGGVNRASLLSLLMPFYDNNFDDIKVTESAPETQHIPLLQRFSKLQTPVNLLQKKGKKVEYHKNLENLFKGLIGSLVHQYYEDELFEPNTQNLHNRLIGIGTPSNEIQHWHDYILRLLSHTRNDVHFDWLFKQRESTLTEAEFFVNERTIIIDRLFIDNEILWIIDFKTAKPSQKESVEQFIERQQTQHTKQLLFYKKTLSKIYNNSVRCALYFPSVSQLVEII